MKKTLTYTLYQVLLLLLFPLFFASCNAEDDVIEIFTGKTWKLTFIATEGSYEQVDFWSGNEAARKKSMEELAKSGTFILNFNGDEINGVVEGEMTGRGISSSITGTWRADGGTRELTLGARTTGSESDMLGKAFLTGIQNAQSYSGDSKNLFIYYKDGQTTKYMAFHPVNQ